MATLAELAGLGGGTDPTTDDDLKAKVTKAMLIIAFEIEGEDPATTNHAERLAVAKSVYENPQSSREKFLRAMVAANNTATIANILAASDASIKTAVRNAWNTFI